MEAKDKKTRCCTGARREERYDQGQDSPCTKVMVNDVWNWMLADDSNKKRQ